MQHQVVKTKKTVQTVQHAHDTSETPSEHWLNDLIDLIPSPIQKVMVAGMVGLPISFIMVLVGIIDYGTSEILRNILLLMWGSPIIYIVVRVIMAGCYAVSWAFQKAYKAPLPLKLVLILVFATTLYIFIAPFEEEEEFDANKLSWHVESLTRL